MGYLISILGRDISPLPSFFIAFPWGQQTGSFFEKRMCLQLSSYEGNKGLFSFGLPSPSGSLSWCTALVSYFRFYVPHFQLATPDRQGGGKNGRGEKGGGKNGSVCAPPPPFAAVASLSPRYGFSIFSAFLSRFSFLPVLFARLHLFCGRERKVPSPSLSAEKTVLCLLQKAPPFSPRRSMPDRKEPLFCPSQQQQLPALIFPLSICQVLNQSSILISQFRTSLFCKSIQCSFSFFRSLLNSTFKNPFLRLSRIACVDGGRGLCRKC